MDHENRHTLKVAKTLPQGKTYRIVRTLESDDLKKLRVAFEAQERELEELVRSLEKIKKTYYSNNTSIKRIQAQTFTEIIRSKIPSVLSSIKQKLSIE